MNLPIHAQTPVVAPQMAPATAASPWQIDFAGPRGVSLAYRGVPILRRSSLYIVKPAWAGLLFDQRAVSPRVTRAENGAVRVESENDDFAARYELIPRDAQTFELRFRGELKRDIPAQIEFAAGYFNANLITNRPFKAQLRGDDAQPLAGLVPNFAATTELTKNELAPGFKTLEFDSRIGKIRLDVESPKPVVFTDARRDTQNWATEAPVFWLGWLAGMQPIKFGAPVEMSLILRVQTPGAARISPLLIKAVVPLQKAVPDAFSKRDEPLQIVPRPQKMSVQSGAPFVLSRDMKVSIRAPRGEKRLSAALQNLLRDDWKIEIPAPREVFNRDKNGWSSIVLGTKPPGAELPKKLPEGYQNTDFYQLKSDKNGIEISAPTARGAFYGLQSLTQLLRPQGDRVSMAPVQIEDFAALQFRGAHWFPSQSGVPFHKKLISLMARAKMNSAVIQCEAARWDSAPAIAAPNSISKADLRSLVELCRANFIDPIPLINTPGHAEWMFRNGQNRDLAEDPQIPYAYSVKNPKSMVFIKQILSEAIDVFQPTTFHLGHDEVTMRGEFPNPKNPFYREGQTATDLVMENLQILHGWLGTRGIKTMVWSDMFLHPDEGANGQKIDAASAPSVEEARKRRQMIPKGVVITDWHYDGKKDYPSLAVFAKDGLQTIASTWDKPDNIRYFSRAARESGALGLLQTTWAGYFPDQNTLDTALSQFTAFVLAGDYAWAPHDVAPSELPYDVIAQWNATFAPPKSGESAGKLLDLSRAGLVAPQDWLGLGAGRDVAKFFAPDRAKSRFDGVNFQIPAPGLIALSKAPQEMAPTGAQTNLTLEIGARAAQIALLHSTLWSVPDGVVAAKMSVEYTDGSQSDFELKTGRTVMPWQSDAVAANARRAWSSKSPDGTPIGLRVTKWDNPFPAKTIARVRFEPIDIEAGYALAGFTLIE